MIAAALGWAGTVGTFAAYLLLMRGRLLHDSLTYSLLNAVGGMLGATATAMYGAWPSVASNIVWAAIGVHSTVVAVRRRMRGRHHRTTTALDVLREPLSVA